MYYAIIDSQGRIGLIDSPETLARIMEYISPVVDEYWLALVVEK
jgi:hypothetical protein